MSEIEYVSIERVEIVKESLWVHVVAVMNLRDNTEMSQGDLAGKNPGENPSASIMNHSSLLLKTIQHIELSGQEQDNTDFVLN